MLVADVAEAAAAAFDLFEEAVEAFGLGVRDAGFQECLDLGPPRLHGAGQGVQLADAGRGAPVVEHIELSRDLVGGGVGAGEREQLAQLFFRDPRGEDLAGRVGVDVGERVPTSSRSLVLTGVPGR